MTPKQIAQLMENKSFPNEEVSSVQLMETHISWVLLTDQFAYKIKKPLKFSFLDFSTLALRKYYCQRELELNRRLAPEVYLKVLPIRQDGTKIMIDGTKGEVIDYALKMKKLDNQYLMSDLLKRHAVQKSSIKQLALILADFHRNAEPCDRPVDIEAQQKDFADILGIKNFLAQQIDPALGETLEKSVAFSHHFLKQHQQRIIQRKQLGFCVDGHGDLHSRNIFLLEKPVVFDCLEFDDHLRKGDLLTELGFLLMDLDFYQRVDLASYFLEQYLAHYPCIENEEDQKLLLYYKMYRANVRMKVTALPYQQASGESIPTSISTSIKQYANLYNRYYQQLTKM